MKRFCTLFLWVIDCLYRILLLTLRVINSMLITYPTDSFTAIGDVDNIKVTGVGVSITLSCNIIAKKL